MSVFSPREQRQDSVSEQLKNNPSIRPAVYKRKVRTAAEILDELLPDSAKKGSPAPPITNVEHIINRPGVDNGDEDVVVLGDDARRLIIFRKAKSVAVSQLESRAVELGENNDLFARENSTLDNKDSIVLPLQYLKQDCNGDWFEKFGPLRTVRWWLGLTDPGRSHWVVELHLAFGIPCAEWCPDVETGPEPTSSNTQKVKRVGYKEFQRLEWEYRKKALGKDQISELPAYPTAPAHIKFNSLEGLTCWVISEHQQEAVEYLLLHIGLKQDFLKK